MRLLSAAADGIRPVRHVESWSWINQHGRTPDGMRFDGSRVPYIRGVCEAWDDPYTREIALMWGTRLGKTMASLQLIAKSAATAPRPGLFATSTQTLSERTVSTKIYPVLEACPKTAPLLPPRHGRSLREIRLSNASWHVAWSGSATQLADLSAFYGVANEIDKWSLDEKQGGDAGEGDALDQFFQRFKEFWNYKVFLESSPSTKSKSRIAKKYNASDRRKYYVPCPHCGEYQTLVLGRVDEPGGVRFDKPEKGRADPSLARATARYECRHCEGEIYDRHRPKMIESGEWLPEGCTIDSSGVIHGKPVRDQRIAGFQLSSLYSLQMSWGSIAQAFVEANNGGPSSLRMFKNGTLGETWEPFQSKSEPEQVGSRLVVDVPAGVVPEWATWLFAGCDVQGDKIVYWVSAYGPGEKEHCVLHGSCESLDQLVPLVIAREFEHRGGGVMTPAMVLIDSGFRTKLVYQFCRKFIGTKHRVWPCKGANTDCGGKAFEYGNTDPKAARSAKAKRLLAIMGREMKRVRVNPYYYEPITQAQIEELNPGDPASLSLHSGSEEDEGFLRDLCNGAESHEPVKTDPHRLLWVKRWESEPNDKRDCKKYARCAADVWFSEYPRASIDVRQGDGVKRQEVVREEAPTRRERTGRRPRQGGRRRGSR